MKRLLVFLLMVVAIAGVSFAAGDNEGAAENEQVTIRLLSRFTGTDATTPVWQETIALFE